MALAAALGLLISPHAWVYDATLLLPALGVLAARAARDAAGRGATGGGWRPRSASRCCGRWAASWA